MAPVLGDGDEPLGTGVLGDVGAVAGAAVPDPDPHEFYPLRAREVYLVPFRTNIYRVPPRPSWEVLP